VLVTPASQDAQMVGAGRLADRKRHLAARDALGLLRQRSDDHQPDRVAEGVQHRIDANIRSRRLREQRQVSGGHMGIVR
jgi:hypothetical protein